MTTWRDVTHLTPKQREWLIRLCDAAVAGCKTRKEAADLCNVTIAEVDSWLAFLTCRTSWPPRFDSMVFQMPIRDEAPKPAADRAWQDELLPLEESDALRGEVLVWLRKRGLPPQAVPYHCLANARRVALFMKGDTCDTFLAAALRRMIEGQGRERRKWQDHTYAEDLRQEHERTWLEQERVKYRLTRQAKPLSRMPV